MEHHNALLHLQGDRVFLPDVNGKFRHHSASQVQGTWFEGV